MTENTNGAAFYPHEIGAGWTFVRIAIESNREDPQTVIGFRPEDTTQ